MRLNYDPFPTIFGQGDEMAKLACLELFGFEESAQAKECVLGVIKKQRFDGSFPSRFDSKQWGMWETSRNTILLSMFGLPEEGLNVRRAMDFILGQQRPEGDWVENPTLDIPPEIVELSTERGVTWLVADIVDLMDHVGMEESLPRQKALEWLREAQNPQGGWYCFDDSIGDQRGSKGDPDSTAQITFLMKANYGSEDPVYQQGLDLFETFLDQYAQDVERGYWTRLRDGKEEPLDVYHLTHLLLSWLFDQPRRFQAGYDVDDARVMKLMGALLDIQETDGGWRPFWAEGSSPRYTMLAVKALVLSGLLEVESLRENVERRLMEAGGNDDSKG